MPGAPGIDLSTTSDRSLWIALLLRKVDGVGDASIAAARAALAGQDAQPRHRPDPRRSRRAALAARPLGVRHAGRGCSTQLPAVPASGSLGPVDNRIAAYRSLDPRVTVNVLDEPGIVQLTLPDENGLSLWQDIDPLEAGVGDLPPSLDDPKLADARRHVAAHPDVERHREAALGRESTPSPPRSRHAS